MERIGILVPRRELVARGARPENAVMQCLPRRLEGLQLLRCYLRSLERTRFSDSAREIIRRHIIDLVTLAMVPDVAIGASNLTAVVSARLAAALEDIAAHYQDPGLSLNTVAHRQRVSPRYLQRLLEMSGTSFTMRVNELRLEGAFKLLTDANDQSRRISDIALHVGFSDISHFNRLFVSRFGDTPSGVRARCRSKQ
jgi:AraC-like DNA-binding protein